MRILHVSPTYLPAVRYGGPIFAIHGLCSALAARGHRIEVYTTNIDGPNNVAEEPGAEVNLDGVLVRYFSSQILRRLSWAPSLAKTLRTEIDGFDVVHIHTVFLWPTWAAAREATRARVPYLISPRGMLFKELIAKRNRLIKTAWLKFMDRPAMEQAGAIHVTSELEANELSRFGWRLPPIVKVSNGVEDPKKGVDGNISKDVANVVAGVPYVLFFGRISWKKGLDLLLKAFARTNHPKLVVAGIDDEGLVHQLSRLANDLKIGNRVDFLPRIILDSDKELLFANAQMFVLPSYSENFGNTVIEAMRRGLPVVVTPEVGAAEIVQAGKGGLVVPGVPDQLAAAIENLSNDPDLLRSMARSGKEYVLKHYGWAQVAAEMEQLYEQAKSRA